jgi:hypothetical protein
VLLDFRRHSQRHRRLRPRVDDEHEGSAQSITPLQLLSMPSLQAAGEFSGVEQSPLPGDPSNQGSTEPGLTQCKPPFSAIVHVVQCLDEGVLRDGIGGEVALLNVSLWAASQFDCGVPPEPT